MVRQFFSVHFHVFSLLRQDSISRISLFSLLNYPKISLIHQIINILLHFAANIFAFL